MSENRSENMVQQSRRRVGVFGWGVVAPGCDDVESFREKLYQGGSWLDSFEDFGPSNFLVGKPDFDLEKYHPWIDERFPPNRFRQLQSKMGLPTLMAVGSFIQALGQNPGIEKTLQELGNAAHVYVGTGLGDLPTISEVALTADKAQRNWDAFWAHPDNCPARAAFDAGDARPDTLSELPVQPESLPVADQEDARITWNKYWASQSSKLKEYLVESREIEGVNVVGEVESNKTSVIRGKMKKAAQLRKDWGVPEEPWNAISPNLLWNIHSSVATQITMMGKITGPSFSPVAACSTFGVALKLGMDAIQRGEAEAVVIGASDPPPHPMVVGAFNAARVLSNDGDVSKPLTGLRGTHISGGSCVWIIGDLEKMTARGFTPIGMEPIGVGLTSDADHIITPSEEGPTASIHSALCSADAKVEEVTSWDLHCTATPGDFLEVQNARKLFHEDILMTARKGTFGHGMGVCGGWELTAQMMAGEEGHVAPTSLENTELNSQISEIHGNFLLGDSVNLPEGLAGKLSMGVGGINACVISRPWATENNPEVR